ncbi:hypothetical protein BaRGS_00035807, partial [Batillaria attramentaria]
IYFFHTGRVVEVGDRVRRGPDWRYEDQDGDPPGQGTVLGPDCTPGWWRVKWDYGHENCYCMGANGKFELEIIWDPKMSYRAGPHGSVFVQVDPTFEGLDYRKSCDGSVLEDNGIPRPSSPTPRFSQIPVLGGMMTAASSASECLPSVGGADWRSNIDSYYFVRKNIPPIKVGDRVRRGPNWRYGHQ